MAECFIALGRSLTGLLSLQVLLHRRFDRLLGVSTSPSTLAAALHASHDVSWTN